MTKNIKKNKNKKDVELDKSPQKSNLAEELKLFKFKDEIKRRYTRRTHKKTTLTSLNTTNYKTDQSPTHDRTHSII